MLAVPSDPRYSDIQVTHAQGKPYHANLFRPRIGSTGDAD